MFFDLFILDLILTTVYLLIYLPGDLRRWRDFKKSISLVPISYMTEKKREELLGSVLFCNTCKTKKLQIEEEEVYKKGMYFLELKCPKCKQEYKQRIDV